jgi:hypothetical protein
VTLNGLADAGFAEDASRHPLLRRWDQRQGVSSEGGLDLATDGAALVVEDQWLDLEDGVKVQFAAGEPNQPHFYRTGEYWLIPARVATGDVEWPRASAPDGSEDVPLALPPKGVEHHYAPLGVVHVNADGVVSVHSCRKQFSPLAVRPQYDYSFSSSGIGVRNLVASGRPARRAKKAPPR